jgi:O-antigen biosynthesis protein
MENKESRIGLYDNCFNEYVFSEVNEKSTCLDVGCWTGNLGEELIRKKGCVVDGMDINEEALEKAKNRGYRNVFEVDLSSKGDLSEIQEKYDFIIFSDVLEHLAEPGNALENMRGFLKDNGQIIVSVPNIAFLQVRLALLFGRFDYNPGGGIMDESHLRFFTLKSIRRLVRKSGYRIMKSYGYAHVKKRYFFLKALSKMFPGIFSVQLLVKAKKDG